jgi:hypothetical protein
MEHKSIYQVNDTTRLVAVYDDFADQWHEVANNVGIKVQTIQASRGIRDVMSGDDHENALCTIIGDSTYQGKTQLIPTFIDSYFQGYNATLESTDLDVSWLIVNLTGYSQGEWHEAVIYTVDFGGVADLREFYTNTLLPTFRNENYFVKVETAKVFTAEDGETLTQWNEDENVEYAFVTEEHFEITEAFAKENFPSLFEVVA